MPYILTIHNPLPMRMLCTKFGIWPNGSKEKVKNVKSIQKDGRTTDIWRSEKLT